MNNNIDSANFDKMLELAEFGAKRHDQRRQIVFRIAIGYLTLLVLVLYQSIKSENLLRLDPGWLIICVICLVVVHIFYCLWQRTAFIAMINDVRRRDFYLMKAQIIAYYLTRSRFSSFNPDPCEEVIVNFAGATAWKTNERSLFKEREPTMINRETSCKKPCTYKRLQILLPVTPVLQHMIVLTAVPGEVRMMQPALRTRLLPPATVLQGILQQGTVRVGIVM